jgi:Zn-dependent peptidase ImmA (M78 family)/transcriptional regulator with XRE-family HTH domain
MPTALAFIGKNIRFFRQSRNWTLFELASRIGIHEGPLGRIERGLNLPSAAVIYQLSVVLNVSVDALFATQTGHGPVTPPNLSDACFVTIDPEPVAPPPGLLNACRDIMGAFHLLEDTCRVQKHAHLPLSVPFTADYKGMEQLAARVRTYLGTGDAVVFDYFELFENFGLRIVLFAFVRGATHIDSISFYEPTFHNAFFFLNSRRNPERQLFSLSCELGKILISNQMRLGVTPLFPCENKDPETHRAITPDRAARRFAATFLMPETAVRTTVGQLGISADGWSFDLLLRIKHRFGVSAQAFLYRLKELDLISDPAAERLDARIKAFYDSTGFKEPDSTRRCLTPNGRFFDLLLTAENMIDAKDDISEIQRLIKRLKIVRK